MVRAATPLFIFLMLAAIFMIAGCAGVETEAKYPSGLDRNQTGGDDNIYGEKQSIFGIDGGKIFGKDDDKDDDGIGVNSFLWRASLDTVSFMPLASADPFGGVILTDWYSPAENADERFKINVFILDRQLRSDGIRVRVFKQKKSGNGWTDIPSADETARGLEDTILTRARQLRIAQLDE